MLRRAFTTATRVARQAGSSGSGAGGRPTIRERAREALDISKEHAKAALKNQAQGVEDVATGRASASNVASSHAAEAKEDIKTWGAELKQAARGEALPGEAQVRDLPPMTDAEGDVQDRVRVTPTKAGVEKPQKTAPPTSTSGPAGRY